MPSHEGPKDSVAGRVGAVPPVDVHEAASSGRLHELPRAGFVVSTSIGGRDDLEDSPSGLWRTLGKRVG
jgi:hypothetical protein